MAKLFGPYEILILDELKSDRNAVDSALEIPAHSLPKQPDCIWYDTYAELNLAQCAAISMIDIDTGVR